MYPILCGSLALNGPLAVGFPKLEGSESKGFDHVVPVIIRSDGPKESIIAHSAMLMGVLSD